MKTDKKDLLGRCSRHFYAALGSVDSRRVSAILDIGCGKGRTFHLLDRFHDAKLFGVDIEMNALSQAKDKCSAVLASGALLPFSADTFDLVIEFHTFHHIPEYEKAVKEVARCLKKGGHFLLVEAVNDNPVFRFLRSKHPIARHMPIESNFLFNELTGCLEGSGFRVKDASRFGLFFEFTLGGIPGAPGFIKKFTSYADGILEKFFGRNKCASCVVFCEKE